MTGPHIFWLDGGEFYSVVRSRLAVARQVIAATSAEKATPMNAKVTATKAKGKDLRTRCSIFAIKWLLYFQSGAGLSSGPPRCH